MTHDERIEACLDALTNYIDDPDGGYPRDYLRKAVIDILAAAGVDRLEAELAEARLQQKAWTDKWDHAISRAEAAEAELGALRAQVNAFCMGTPESRLLAMTKERDALREMVDSTKVAAWDKCAEITRRAQAAEAERDRLREVALYFAHCPQCACAEACADDCTFALDAPNDRQHMLLLRSALRGGQCS